MVLKDPPISEKVKKIDDRINRIHDVITEIHDRLDELIRLGLIDGNFKCEIQNQLSTKWWNPEVGNPIGQTPKLNWANKEVQKISYLLMQALSKPYREACENEN